MELPKTYDEWFHCITVKCEIKLSRDFIERRLAVYSDSENLETIKFTQLYGHNHTRQTLEWFKEAQQRVV